MKKSIKITLSALALFAFSFQSNAASCNGGIAYFCGVAEALLYTRSAMANCCAGSVIPTYDYCLDAPGNIYVHVDGANSSCAPE